MLYSEDAFITAVLHGVLWELDQFPHLYEGSLTEIPLQIRSGEEMDPSKDEQNFHLPFL